MEISVKNRRASLFCSAPLQFNEELVNAYVNEFSPKDLVPSVNKAMGLKITPKGLSVEDVISLEMKKLDDSFRVVFSNDRIDIDSNNSNDSMNDFLTIANEIQKTLIEKMNLTFVRLALCESLVYQLSEAQRSVAYKAIVNKEEPAPVEWQFQNVKRSKVSSEGENRCEVIVNEVVNVKCPETVDNGIMFLDMDINTKVGTPADQILAISDLFWPHANNVIDRIINDFKSKFEDAEN